MWKIWTSVCVGSQGWEGLRASWGCMGGGLWRVGFPQLAASGLVGACYLCQQPVEQPTKQPESKEALGTPLIVHALGSS
ncbi:hypothetical protein SRHO_G00107960 [Serrasalmus rhombeus]